MPSSFDEAKSAAIEFLHKYREAGGNNKDTLDLLAQALYVSERYPEAAKELTQTLDAMEREDCIAFGRLLSESHASLRDRLRVSSPALDALVQAAMESGAQGARLTGAGFGGCAVVLCRAQDAARVRRGLIERFYSGCIEFDESRHLIDAVPGPGALHPETQ